MKFTTYDTLPAGTYFIGDPCYVIPDEQWSDALMSTGYMGLYSSRESMSGDSYDGPRFGMWAFQGFLFGSAGTKYGDGEYFDQHGNSYSVDAGMIGAVPLALCDSESIQGDAKDLGRLVTFFEPFDIRASDNGTIHIGDIEIYTGDEILEDCGDCGTPCEVQDLDWNGRCYSCADNAEEEEEIEDEDYA